MKISAGILMFRNVSSIVREFFLVHPGGPIWKDRDEGSWSIPKGEVTNDDYLKEAIREFTEETGLVTNFPYYYLGNITQKSGKVVHGYATKTNITGNPVIKSNTCEIEYPYNSGKIITITEVDRGEFFSFEDAKIKINPAQIPFLEKVMEDGNITRNNICHSL